MEFNERQACWVAPVPASAANTAAAMTGTNQVDGDLDEKAARGADIMP
jgi:hypothetical protein